MLRSVRSLDGEMERSATCIGSRCCLLPFPSARAPSFAPAHVARHHLRSSLMLDIKPVRYQQRETFIPIKNDSETYEQTRREQASQLLSWCGCVGVRRYESGPRDFLCSSLYAELNASYERRSETRQDART